MPAYDGTGPRGAGPRTGRGFGPCGRGFRRGFGWRWQDEPLTLTKEEQAKILEAELKELKA